MKEEKKYEREKRLSIIQQIIKLYAFQYHCDVNLQNPQSVTTRMVVYRTASNDLLVRSTKLIASIKLESLHHFLDWETLLFGQGEPSCKEIISARNTGSTVDNLGRLHSDISYIFQWRRSCLSRSLRCLRDSGERDFLGDRSLFDFSPLSDDL